jgi:hypothetical protein
MTADLLKIRRYVASRNIDEMIAHTREIDARPRKGFGQPATAGDILLLTPMRNSTPPPRRPTSTVVQASAPEPDPRVQIYRPGCGVKTFTAESFRRN